MNRKPLPFLDSTNPKRQLRTTVEIDMAVENRREILILLGFCRVKKRKLLTYKSCVFFVDLSHIPCTSSFFFDPPLKEARLDLRSWERLRDDDDIFGDVLNLVEGISNVKTLHLSSDSLEVFHLYCDTMPMFYNLLTLSFESDKEKGWRVVPLLLSNSPNLETLLIKGLVHEVTDRCGDACVCIPKRKRKRKKMEEGMFCLSTCQVKVLKISGYRGTCKELKQMRHFLGNLKCLETVQVGVKVNRRGHKTGNNKYLRITNALMKFLEFHQTVRSISSDFYFRN